MTNPYIPSNSDRYAKQNPPPTKPTAPTPSTDPETQSTLKDTIEKAARQAVTQLTAILNNYEASPAEIISAASKIIAMAHGKDGLRLEEEQKVDAAQQIAAALQQHRFATTPEDIYQKFRHDVRYASEFYACMKYNLNMDNLFEAFIKAIKDPTEYLSTYEAAAKHNH